MSGTEMQRQKEGAAEIMRQKQAAGTQEPRGVLQALSPPLSLLTRSLVKSRGEKDCSRWQQVIMADWRPWTSCRTRVSAA